MAQGSNILLFQCPVSQLFKYSGSAVLSKNLYKKNSPFTKSL